MIFWFGVQESTEGDAAEGDGVFGGSLPQLPELRGGDGDGAHEAAQAGAIMRQHHRHVPCSASAASHGFRLLLTLLLQVGGAWGETAQGSPAKLYPWWDRSASCGLIRSYRRIHETICC